MNIITQSTNDAVFSKQYLLTDEASGTPILAEQTMHFSFPNTEFTSRQQAFDGIAILEQRWTSTKHTAEERCSVLFNHDFDGVYLDFLLSGKQTCTNNRWQKAHVMAGQEQNILYTQGYNGAMWSDTPQSEMFVLKIDKPIWLQLTANANPTLQRFADAVNDGRSAPLARKNLPLDHNMKTVIQQIQACSYREKLKKMFLYSKCLELIVLQAEAHHSQGKTPGNTDGFETARIARSEKEQLYYAQDYVRHCLDEPPSLAELAAHVGLNEYKLKRGFKAMFGTSVFGYIAEHRLERAQMLLLQREKSVSEIAYELGYSSPQHFSTAYKKKFGIPPKYVRS